jgi:hypothetical protein
LIRHYCNHPFYGNNSGKAYFLGLVHSDFEYDLTRYEFHLKDHKGTPNPKVEQNFLTTYSKLASFSPKEDFPDTILSISASANVTGATTGGFTR